jgi:hypothetical protein
MSLLGDSESESMLALPQVHGYKMSVALHNKFPAYFYKRGNLFNTYLGYSDDQPLPKVERRPGRERSRQQASATPQQRLVGFTQANMTFQEGRRFLELLAIHANVSGPRVNADWEVWNVLSRFCVQHVDDKQAEKYLAALKARQSSGQPLIQR